MKTLELEKFDVLSMEEMDLQLTTGGASLPKWFKAGGWTFLASQIIENWAEIKQGFADGYRAKI